MNSPEWREFIELAEKREMSFSALCERFGVSRKTGYKWLNRYRDDGEAGLHERSRRPRRSPRQTKQEVVAAVLAARRDFPEATIARLREVLIEREIAPLPAPSTIDLILRRQREAALARQQALAPAAGRFEPNFRWLVRVIPQVRLGDGALLDVIALEDEASGYILDSVLSEVRSEGVSRGWLEAVFRRHGLPWQIALPALPVTGHSVLTVWLMRLGVTVEFQPTESGQPGGAGTVAMRELSERLSMLPVYQRDALMGRLEEADGLGQIALQLKRVGRGSASSVLARCCEQHNLGGAAKSIGRRSPISLYRPSLRRLPAKEPEVVPDADAEVRLVSEKGMISYRRRLVQIGRVFAGLSVELKLTVDPDTFVVFFAGQLLGRFCLRGTAADGTASLPLQEA